MPQMAPTWWLMLFLTFTMTFISIMTIMYFLNMYMKKTHNKMMISKKTNNWKW